MTETLDPPELTGPKIGFIGQGWIGRHYADDFEARGFETVRYALEQPYRKNQQALTSCGIVFVAVPTPSTPQGFSYEPVREVLGLVSPGATVVVKSTLLPGTTQTLQAEFPRLFVMHSPEFLREASAAYDASHPDRNIIGIPIQNDVYRARAREVMAVLPSAPFQTIMGAYEAELVKYAGNCFLYSKVLFMNALYDLMQATDANWEEVRGALIRDPRIGESHTKPVHASGHNTGNPARGAGGHCFIKDFEAFRRFVAEQVGDETLSRMLDAMVAYNNQLLIGSGKDLDILAGVYGADSVTD